MINRPPRERLGADRVYFVRTDGDNANNGFSDTRSGAFRDWQRAIDIASQLDFNGHQVAIQAGDEAGTAEFLHNVTVCPLFGGGRLLISGNGPDKTTWGSVAGDTWTLSSTGSVQVLFQSGHLKSAANGIKVNYSSLCDIGDNVRFGGFGEAAIWIHDNQAICQILNARNVSIQGRMKSFLFIQYGHCFLEGSELTGRGASFEHGFITMYPRGSAQVIGNSTRGSATGKRYSLSHVSLLNLNGSAEETQLLGDQQGVADASSVVF